MRANDCFLSFSRAASIARCCVAFSAFAIGSSLFALTPNLPTGDVSSQLVINTRTGELRNAVRYAPNPVIPPATLAKATGSHGVFAVDIGVVTGIPYSVRTLKSTGSKEVDNVVTSTLQQWRFRPRSIYKAIVPVDITRAPTPRSR